MEKKPYELQSEEEKKAHYDSRIKEMMEGYETITFDEDEDEADSPAGAEAARKDASNEGKSSRGRKKKEQALSNIRVRKDTHRSLAMLQLCLKFSGQSLSQSDIIDKLLTKKHVKSVFGEEVVDMFEKTR